MAKKRILIVEDESIVARDIRSSLNNLGYEVGAFVSSGEEAVQKAVETRPDLVLMDIYLKGKMNGVQAADRIQKDLHIPVIYLTAHADEKTLKGAKITEPYGYILKPFEEKELYILIEMALYRHAMQRKLQESQQWLSTTLRSIGDAVVATDDRGAVIFMNPVAEALAGCPEEAAVGRSMEEVLRLQDERTGTATENPALEVLRQGATVRSPSPRILVARDGRKRPVDDLSAPIRDEQGKIIGAVLTFRDMTERRRLEEEVRQAQEMKFLGQIAAGVAHEVRNPLNAILSIHEALFQEIGGNPEYKPYLDHIRTQVDRLSRLMKDLLDLGKPSRPAALHPESLGAICAATLTLWKGAALAGAHPVRCLLRPEADASLVPADSSRVQQVLMNLLENAAQNSPEASEILLEVLEPQEERVKIRIVDRGAGIPPADLEKVFEPFFTTRKGGTGLGLALVRQMVKSAGGEVRLLNNEPPPGCCAEVVLPVVKEGAR